MERIWDRPRRVAREGRNTHLAISRLDGVEDQISELKDKAEKEHTVTATK